MNGLESLWTEVGNLRSMAVSAAGALRAGDYPDPDALASARNFAAYIGIRGTDVRDLQRDLHRHGLSSLGRIETHTLDSLERVSAILGRLTNHPADPAVEGTVPDYDRGEEILARRTEQLLGPPPAARTPRIMVTLPPEAAERYDLVRNLVGAGMEVARINSTHDDEGAWDSMVRHVRRARTELGRPVLTVFDLPGPKLRTGPVETGPGVVRWHAFKNTYGEVIAPARVWLSAGASPPKPAHAVLPVTADFVAELRAGDEIHFQDHQGRDRWIVVKEAAEAGAWAEAVRGAFMVEGIRLKVRREGSEVAAEGRVGRLPREPLEIALKVGDTLWLTAGEELGRPARKGEAARIGCTVPNVIQAARPGQKIYFDDGKIAAVVEESRPNELRLRITWTRSANNARLAGGKGINVPDTRLELPPLMEGDRAALDFVAGHREGIDGVGLSFLRDAEGVRALYQELERRKLDVGTILKIESAAAFANLPEIILTALRRNKVGVMIARGDLGVEVGFERMAELQEEIASLCAAAHLPVVWATQVLESLAKKGMPSRAEVSDVVLAARTQCVMLNKGPHLVEAVKFLANVLGRMEGHQDKHFRLLRALKVAQTYGRH